MSQGLFRQEVIDAKRGIVIHDPGRGVRKLRMKEVSEHFTGVALELLTPSITKPRAARGGNADALSVVRAASLPYFRDPGRRRAAPG